MTTVPLAFCPQTWLRRPTPSCPDVATHSILRFVGSRTDDVLLLEVPPRFCPSHHFSETTCLSECRELPYPIDADGVRERDDVLLT